MSNTTNTRAKSLPYQKVLNFWFKESGPSQWFVKDNKFDATIKKNFLKTHQKVIKGETSEWRNEPQGRLAEIIVIDQFSRNMFRGDPRSFYYDPIALVLAQEALRIKAHAELNIDQKPFLFLPFMHSESKLIHEKALELFSTPGLEKHLEYEIKHKAIIDRFGRYPHRNEILGRKSTPEEIAFLKEPDSSF